MGYSHELEYAEVSDYQAELLELQGDALEDAQDVAEAEDEVEKVFYQQPAEIFQAIDALEVERWQAEKRGDFRHADKLDEQILNLLAQL